GFIQPAFYFDNDNLLNNDLFVTSEIPTTEKGDEKFKRFHISANQSRISFGFKFPRVKKNITAFLEGDFLSSSRGDHNYFRLRHSYLTVDDFLVGQTWTNFGDVSGSPNTLDLEGPNSMPASRVAQVRWTKKLNDNFKLLFAIEEPKGDYTPLDSASTVKAAFPELVVKPDYNFKKGQWVSALIYKPIVYTDKNYSFKKNLKAWGFSSSLTLNVSDKKLHGPFATKKRTINFFGIMGEGTQGSVNDFGGLGFEAFPKDNTSLETLLYYGGYVSYSFVFRKRWSSTYVYSYLHQERPATTDNIFKQSHYFSANALLAIDKYFTVGTEFLYGIKEDYDNTKGEAMRVLCIIRLLF
ncbi:MAG: DcaP family trimeric outer membrane transporter, partial [Flavisolibacter sp.]